jgi:AmiR/NasT family two-component response regulator
MALGLLMARLNISSDQAFQRLSQASQRTNVKVRDLAVSLVAAHHPPRDWAGLLHRLAEFPTS